MCEYAEFTASSLCLSSIGTCEVMCSEQMPNRQGMKKGQNHRGRRKDTTVVSPIHCVLTQKNITALIICERLSDSSV